MVSSRSVLFVTLDSCRYDTFVAADAPNLKAVAPVHLAQSPSHFTYGSHAAMFVGFTPGLPGARQRFLDPKYARLFRLGREGFVGLAEPGFTVAGRDIVHGFRAADYRTFGTSAMAWFDPASPVARTLIDGFEAFNYVGHTGAAKQVAWAQSMLDGHSEEDVFLFVNVGETHVPYHYEGAPWSFDDNPCVPFQSVDRSQDCRERQRLCCEYVDRALAPLVERFQDATILVCGDHGDCWGEDGLWEHGTSHPMTLTVPLLIRYKGEPVMAE
jgi:hypothetical protein